MASRRRRRNIVVAANPGAGHTIITLLLVGGGAYLLYSWLTSSATAVASPTAAPGQSPTQSGSTTNVGTPKAITTGNTGQTSTSNVTPPSNIAGTTVSSTGQIMLGPFPVTTPPAGHVQLTAQQILQLNQQLTSWMTANGLNPAATFTGYHWQSMAQSAWGANNYINPTNVVGTQNYTMVQFMQAYVNHVAGIAGLGCCGGMGTTDANFMYQAMIAPHGWAIGDFHAPIANKYSVLN